MLKADLIERFNDLSSLNNHGLLVLEDGGVKGWVHLEIVYDLIEEKKVEIKALIVDENSRSKGYGHALIKAAREWTKQNKLNTIYLSCNTMRDRAHDFYLREGFTKVKTSHFFETKV